MSCVWQFVVDSDLVHAWEKRCASTGRVTRTKVIRGEFIARSKSVSPKSSWDRERSSVPIHIASATSNHSRIIPKIIQFNQKRISPQSRNPYVPFVWHIRCGCACAQAVEVIGKICLLFSAYQITVVSIAHDRRPIIVCIVRIEHEQPKILSETLYDRANVTAAISRELLSCSEKRTFFKRHVILNTPATVGHSHRRLEGILHTIANLADSNRSMRPTYADGELREMSKARMQSIWLGWNGCSWGGLIGKLWTVFLWHRTNRSVSLTFRFELRCFRWDCFVGATEKAFLAKKQEKNECKEENTRKERI